MLWLLAIVLVAALFRLTDLGATPPGLFIDEAQDGLDAWSSTTGKSFPIWVRVPGIEARGREPMYHYLLAAAFRLAGPSVLAIRSTSAMIGIATVAVFFLFCQRLMGLRFAVIAGTLLAVSRWHATFSRIGMRAIVVPLFVALAALALTELAKRKSRGAAVALGLVLGLGFYTYPSWWIVPPSLGVVAFVLWRNSRSTRCPRCGAGNPAGGSLADLEPPAGLPAPHSDSCREERIQALRLALVVIGVSILVAAPLAIYAAMHPDRVFARPAETVERAFGRESRAFVLRDNVQKNLLMLHVRGDAEARHNMPGAPLLDPVTGVAFLAGLVLAVRGVRRGEALWIGVMLIWLLSLLPSIVTENSPHAMRTLGAVPAVLFVAAAGIDLLTRIRASRAVIGAILLAAALWNGQQLRAWGRDPRVAESFSTGVVRFVDHLTGLARTNDVLLSPALFHSPNQRFLNLERKADFRVIDDPSFLITRTSPRRDRLIVSDSAEISLLVETFYPGAEIVSRFSTYAGPVGRIYRIRREQLRRSLGPHELPVAQHLTRRALEEFARTAAVW